MMRRMIAVALAWMLALCGRPALADAAMLGVVYGQAGNTFNDAVVQGFEEAQAELGFVLLHDGPDDASVEGQIAIIEDYIQQGVDAIAVSANDPEGLVGVLQSAMARGIKVISWDAGVNAEGRLLHMDLSNMEQAAGALVREMARQTGGVGRIAVLRGSAAASGRDILMEDMEEELGKEAYQDIELVAMVYGDDLYDTSYQEMQRLIDAWPDLSGLIAPTTVGIRAAAACIQDNGLAGKIKLTGLGLPSEMAAYLRDGTCEGMYLWNPVDWGYATAYAAMALVHDDIEGKVGETFAAGRMGMREIIDAGDGGVSVVGDPFYFNARNIDGWEDVY